VSGNGNRRWQGGATRGVASVVGSRQVASRVGGVAEEEGDAEADAEGGRGGGNGGSRVSDDVAWTAGAVMHYF
jgi:hypothetical protein